MPIHKIHDKTGTYFQYGKSGSKYYYKNEKEKEIAYQLAVAQSRAIHANKGGSSIDLNGEDLNEEDLIEKIYKTIYK